MEKIISKELLKVKEKLEEYNRLTKLKIEKQTRLKEYFEILKKLNIEVLK